MTRFFPSTTTAERPMGSHWLATPQLHRPVPCAGHERTPSSGQDTAGTQLALYRPLCVTRASTGGRSTRASLSLRCLQSDGSRNLDG